MAAFNWIEFLDICPSCLTKQLIVSQTHVASDFDSDCKERFHDVTYRLGEKMKWWSRSHPSNRDWKNGNLKVKHQFSNLNETPAFQDSSKNEVTECCYANCSVCNVELYAIIGFRDCSPIQVLQVGFEDDWPESYSM